MPISPTRRRTLIAGSLICVAPALITRAHAATGAVRPLRAPWDSFWFGGYVAAAGLERLGYTVGEPRVMTPAAMFQTLAQGDAEFTMDVVMPSSRVIHETVKDRVELLGPTVEPGSVAGYLIDKATAEKHGIRNITDFQKPEVATLFAEGADKRARLIGPGAGWNDEKRALDDINRLGLKDTVNLVIGEYNVMVADVVARQRAGKPVFFYAWFPNIATVELMPGREVVWLEEPGSDPKLAFQNVPGCASQQDSCNTGWSSTTYYVGGNTAWLDANPSARKFLSALRMQLNDRVEQNLLMVKGEKRERDIERHAAEWIKANQAAFDGWVESART
ncbi:glycine betaine/L-proline ABC transporter substrate-binding protein ProX [Verticiella sediminum]|uniref:Glycine betaine/L-proline ABC transporter substrate-binding protein ProX n=1 Tax=Verticiella sediminum TaxID=1247510 RepID=A0A556AWL2_9BURK|nr:glycine betaine/L-proline ABC transporter substrate-binding protein ProX [Verticiella sediminum]TSH97343.1 glycine betaine/L-proline ABC transporter substrate-binding protein ProX [Verticiella sediminum]